MSYQKQINAECKQCNGITRKHPDFNCMSNCQLNNMNLTPLKRIKAHCLECVGDENKYNDVRECNGRVICSDTGKFIQCPLHFYRMGKNPKLKGRSGGVANLQRINEAK